MPRLVKIPECSHEVFAKIRGVFLDNAPWAIRNDIYETETKTAFFFFEDSAYIPSRLQHFILSPPYNLQIVDNALNCVDEELELIKLLSGGEEVDKEESPEIPMIAIALDEEFEKELAGLPEKVQESLRNWKTKQEESTK